MIHNPIASAPRLISNQRHATRLRIRSAQRVARDVWRAYWQAFRTVGERSPVDRFLAAVEQLVVRDRHQLLDAIDPDGRRRARRRRARSG